MHGLLSKTLLCKAMLRFKNRTWYDDHENSVEHSTVMVSTGEGTSHINKGKFWVITIKQIYLTNSGCLPYVPHTETALALCLTKRPHRQSQLWAMRCHPSCRWRVMSSFMPMAVIFHFNWGFRWLQTFNALIVGQGSILVTFLSRVCRNLDWTPWGPSQPRTQQTWRRGWNQSSHNQSCCVGCAVVVQHNEVRSSLVAQSIPVRQQVTGQDFYVVLCGIRCPVNLHQLRPAILKMSPKNPTTSSTGTMLRQ